MPSSYWLWLLLSAVIMFSTAILFNNHVDNIKKWAEVYGFLGGLVVAAISGYNAITTYQTSVRQEAESLRQEKKSVSQAAESAHLERVNNAFNLHLRYISTDSISKSRSLISTADKAHLTKEKGEEIFSGEPEEVDKKWTDFLDTLIKEENLYTDIENMVLFYKEVHICIISNRCDEDTTNRFFLEDAKALYYFFYPYFMKQRETSDPSYADDLMEYVKAYESMD